MEQPEQNTVDVLFEKGRQGDIHAEMAISRYAQCLGRLIAIASIAYSCRLFIINGGIAGSWNQFEQIVKDSIKTCGFSPFTDQLIIRKSEIKDVAALIGGAWMVFNNTRLKNG